MEGKKLKAALFGVLLLGLTGGLVSGYIIFGVMKITYRIIPVNAEISISPNPVSLDLGNLTAGTSGSKWFWDACILNLTVYYEVTVSMVSSMDDFESWTITISSSPIGVYYVLSEDFMSRWSHTELIDAGVYSLNINLDYRVKALSSESFGEIVIDFKY